VAAAAVSVSSTTMCLLLATNADGGPGAVADEVGAGSAHAAGAANTTSAATAALTVATRPVRPFAANRRDVRKLRISPLPRYSTHKLN
jgi:hypothetical protein